MRRVHRLAFVALLCSLTLTAVVRGEQQAPADQLPPGAISRLQRPTGSFTRNTDGALAITADGKTMIVVREMASGDQSTVIPNPDLNVWTAVFARNTRFVALGMEDGAIRVWDLRDGVEAQRFSGHAAGVSVLALAPDGSKLASAAEDGSAFVWNISRAK
ncbi:MAG: hypothetical protein K2Y23_25795 [Cyanobacteria bacterium]|nr:hypothetical protein [Cyanobacteriota bacterium]